MVKISKFFIKTELDIKKAVKEISEKIKESNKIDFNWIFENDKGLYIQFQLDDSEEGIDSGVLNLNDLKQLELIKNDDLHITSYLFIDWGIYKEKYNGELSKVASAWIQENELLEVNNMDNDNLSCSFNKNKCINQFKEMLSETIQELITYDLKLFIQDVVPVEIKAEIQALLQLDGA